MGFVRWLGDTLYLTIQFKPGLLKAACCDVYV